MRTIFITIIIYLATVSEARRVFLVPDPTLEAEEKKLITDQFHQGNADPFVKIVFERFPEMCLIPTDFWTLLLGNFAECIIRDASQEEEMTLTLEDKQRLLRLNSTCALEDETECHRPKCWLKKSLEEGANLSKKFGEQGGRIVKRCKKKGPREENFKKVIKEKFFQGNLDPLLGFIFNSQPKICIYNGNDIYSLKSGKIEDCIKDASAKGEITLTTEEDQKLLNINSTCTEKAKTSCDRNVCILKEDLKLLSDLYKKSPSINQLTVDRCIPMTTLGTPSSNSQEASSGDGQDSFSGEFTTTSDNLDIDS